MTCKVWFQAAEMVLSLIPHDMQYVRAGLASITAGGLATPLIATAFL